MNKNSKAKSEIPILKNYWPLFALNGIQSIAFGSFIFLILPLSLLMWPDDPYHALEIGILITTLYWTGSFFGLIFGKLVDKFPRIYIIFTLSLVRGTSVLLLGFATPGKGYTTYFYFYVLIFIFGVAAGGWNPSLISFSGDAVPTEQRSQFFGFIEIVRNLSTVIGFLFASYLFQTGYWRELYYIVGCSIIIMGIIVLLRVPEAKRGAQRDELKTVLSNDSIIYDFDTDKKLLRKTMFSKTNRVALFEGIFTWILLSSINMLILPYVQGPPHNIAPFSTAVFMITFGLTGGLLGSIFLAKLCDKIAKEKPIRRLPLISFAITGGLATFALFFFLPWPHLTTEQGEDVAFMMTIPTIWIMGIMFFMSRAIFTLYIVNQAPVLQEINLPEALGKVTSYNQFLESFGRGLGPLLAGILMFLTFNNYQLTALILILFILPGILLWLLALRWFPDDIIVIKNILNERAEVLETKRAEV